MLLQPGAEVSAPAIEDQITYPGTWALETPCPSRRTKAGSIVTLADAEYAYL
ncbi:hypothetical protein ABWJ92_22515 [Streptomyces sp. NPDC000609]|uniref:hypothetical protein n=1 Tax=Streptomyces sp. NPDC000609 TaxID=3160957 RepID=UPI003393E4A0